MNNDTRTYAVDLLETTPERQSKIALLHYELEHPACTSKDEMIGAMALGHGDGSGHADGHISDKTLYIALNYQNRADKLNADIKQEIVVQLVELEREQDRLEYYMSLLEERQAEVLQLTYFKNLSQEETAKSLGLSVRTIQSLKSKALSALMEMYHSLQINQKADILNADQIRYGSSMSAF